MTNQSAQHTEVLPEGVGDSDPDIIFGFEAIGREINKSPKEVGYLLNNTTLFDGVVKRISHKITIASRRGLRNLAITARARD
jgi:hypothetical protein